MTGVFPYMAVTPAHNGAVVSSGNPLPVTGTSTLSGGAQTGVNIPAGDVTGYAVLHRAGRNAAVGTSFAPIALGGIFRTPQSGSATTLRIKSGGSANDTAAGTGAREVTLSGIDETGAAVSEAVATAGASASSATTATFTRLLDAYVSAAGSYADPNTPTWSQADDITIENGAGGTDWATIAGADIGFGASQIAGYTVPTGKIAYLKSALVTAIASAKTDVVLMSRSSILETSAPYAAARHIRTMVVSDKPVQWQPNTAIGPYAANTDILAMAKTSAGSADVTVDLEIILEDAA